VVTWTWGGEADGDVDGDAEIEVGADVSGQEGEDEGSLYSVEEESAVGDSMAVSFSDFLVKFVVGQGNG